MFQKFEKKLVEALEENNIFRGMATVIRTSSGTRKIPIAEDTGEASWIDEGEEIPESDTTFGQTMLSAYKLGTMIKISNELLNDSAFVLDGHQLQHQGFVAEELCLLAVRSLQCIVELEDLIEGQQRQLYLEAGSGDRQAGYPAEPSAEDFRLHAGDQGWQQGHGLWRLQLLLGG